MSKEDRKARVILYITGSQESNMAEKALDRIAPEIEKTGDVVIADFCSEVRANVEQNSEAEKVIIICSDDVRAGIGHESANDFALQLRKIDPTIDFYSFGQNWPQRMSAIDGVIYQLPHLDPYSYETLARIAVHQVKNSHTPRVLKEYFPMIALRI